MTDHESLSQLCCELIEKDEDAVAQIDPGCLLELGADENTILLDVRTTDERSSEGFIPGDVHVPLDKIESHAEAVLFGHMPAQSDLDRPVICYCAAGVRSVTAAAKLKSLGFSHPLSLIGGITRFASLGGPVEQAE